MAADSVTPLDHPPVAPSDTRRTVTSSRWDVDEAVPLVAATVGELLETRARQHPDRTALVATRHDTTATRLTYAELLDEARRVAAALRRVADPGEHVALWAPNVAEWPVIEYAASLAGVVLVALNPVLRGPELQDALELSRASVLIHADSSRDYDMAHVANTIAPAIGGLRHVISLGDTERLSAPDGAGNGLDAAPDPGRPAMVQFTSGTTGRAKAVLLTHRSLVNNARLTMITAEVPACGVGVVPLPMFHTAACVISTLGPAWLGGTQVLLERFVPADALAAMTAEGADVLFSVPTILGAVLETARTADRPPSLTTVLVGAATVPGSMIEAVRTMFGASVHNLYGQTELSPVLSLTRRSDTLDDLVTTVGRPLPHTAAAVLDPAGAVVPVGAQGEICARGHSRMVRYFGDDGATAATIDADGWLHTGDLGTMDDRGLITISGRLKELIIRGGENIAPAEIEVALAAHTEVVAAAVVGLPDEHWGEIVAAAVIVRDPGRTGVLDDLAEHCRDHLAAYKRPARWFLVDELPTTPSGKVQKFVLRDRLTTTAPEPSTPGPAPSSDT